MEMPAEVIRELDRCRVIARYGIGLDTVDVDEATATTLMKLIDTLDDDDDVQTVWGNYEIPDEVMEKLG